jgi:hypothetical protein
MYLTLHLITVLVPHMLEEEICWFFLNSVKTKKEEKKG